MIVNALRGFDFSIEDYINSKPGIIERARKYLCNCTFTDEEIHKYLNAIFLEKKRKSVKWDIVLLPLSDGDKISCTVNEKKEYGIVRISPKKLCVEYRHNGKLTSASIELLELAPVIFTEEPFDGSSANNYAISRAKSLLLDLIYNEKN